jgi:hypothetical protein
MTLKTKFYIFLGVLLLGYIIYQEIRYSGIKKKYDIQSVKLMNLNDTAKVYKTKTGELYSQLSSVTIDRDALKTSLDESGFEIKQLKQKDIEWRNIVDALKLKLESSGHDTTRLHDTTYVAINGTKLNVQFYNWTNNYLTLSGMIMANKSMSINYNYSTQLYYTNEQIGHQSKITVWSSDPNSKITMGSQITVSVKPKWYEKWWVHELVGFGVGKFLLK